MYFFKMKTCSQLSLKRRHRVAPQLLARIWIPSAHFFSRATEILGYRGNREIPEKIRTKFEFNFF